MRKRTYTALDEPSNYVSKWETNSSQDVLQKGRKKSTLPVQPIVDVPSHVPVSALDTTALSLGVARPDSLCGVNDSITPAPVQVSPHDEDEIPLTTIHNLVKS